jgi:hypothetical protein
MILTIMIFFAMTLIPAQVNKTDAIAMQVAPTPTHVLPSARQIGTFYFNWYDSITGGHLDPEEMNTHPIATPQTDWHSVTWQKQQLNDMATAGIDFLLLNYWGTGEDWSLYGLAPILVARDELIGESVNAPKVALFFDTTVVNGRDLMSTEDKEWFYQEIKYFFDMEWICLLYEVGCDPYHWATINDRPVIVLFTSDYTGEFDQGVFDHLYYSFNQDYGVYPYVIREVSWDHPQYWVNGVRYYDTTEAIYTDNSYKWGAALDGYNPYVGIASVGPGYDDRGLPGREGWYTSRDNGAFYVNNFWAAIEGGKRILFIETWNELHEATGIGRNVEYGDSYFIDHAPGSALFKYGTPTPVTPPAPTPTPCIKWIKCR